MHEEYGRESCVEVIGQFAGEIGGEAKRFQSISGAPVLSDTKDDKLFKDLVLNRVILMAGGISCSSPMFSNESIFNCTTMNGVSSQKRVQYVPIAAKLSWSVIIVLYWACLLIYTPTFMAIKTRYKCTDYAQLFMCIIFLIVLGGLLFEKLKTRQTLVGQFISHAFGICFAATSFMFFTILAAMKGKSPRTINTKYNNVFAKWFNVFQALTDVDNWICATTLSAASLTSTDLKIWNTWV